MSSLTRASALIVEPTVSDTPAVIPILATLGLQVTLAETFEKAKEALRVPHALLITELRLGAFNGLHLVMRAMAAHPAIRAVVTSTVQDACLIADAEALGATFVLKPTGKSEWSAAIMRTMLRNPNSSVPVRAPFERRSCERRRGASEGFANERRQMDRRTDFSVRLTLEAEARG